MWRPQSTRYFEASTFRTTLPFQDTFSSIGLFPSRYFVWRKLTQIALNSIITFPTNRNSKICYVYMYIYV